MYKYGKELYSSYIYRAGIDTHARAWDDRPLHGLAV